MAAGTTAACSGVLAALVFWLSARLSLATSKSLPPFFDYDCCLVSTQRDAYADWDSVFKWVDRDVWQVKLVDASFKFPSTYLHLLQGPGAERAESECPLGVLYLSVLQFYSALGSGLDSEELLPLANRVHGLLGRFEAYEIALSRWPIFAAFEHYAPSHEPKPDLFCDGVHGVLDWGELRQLSLRWAEIRRDSTDGGEEIDAIERGISDMFYAVLRYPDNQNAAQDECIFGFYFLVASQVVAAANRETQHLPAFNSIINSFLVGQPFPKIAGSGWPIFTVLVIFSDLNKGLWFFRGDRKYLRGYGDWDLRSDELSPLVPRAVGGFLSEPWRAAVRESASSLARLAPEAFAADIRARTLALAEAQGEPRPVVRALLDAALAIAAASPGTSRRLAYVVLLYGAAWARLLGRLAGRLRQLGARHPLFVVAIGAEAAAACRELAAGPGHRVVCWSPASQSQVHRFIAMNALLHLGVDLIYMDMDTFLLRDPAPRILALAEGYDALFAGHADADCVNIGVFYLRSGPQTSVWLSQFLAWYHDHPFEIDQRGLHVFLGLPSQRMKVAYPPEDLVEIRAAKLDDVNEVVIFDVGWHGDLSKMYVMHWCHRPLALKEYEINQAYDAGDVADEYGVDLPSLLVAASAAPPKSQFSKIVALRDIVEVYRKSDPPIREPCW